MKNLLFGVMILTIIIASCETDHEKATEIPVGIYSGTFQRQFAFGVALVVNVSITFSENTWSGQSDTPKYPALCHGTFSLEKGKIVFTNDCAWTADFDWSLILGGTYDFTLDGNQLIISKEYSGPSTDAWADEYILTKQE